MSLVIQLPSNEAAGGAARKLVRKHFADRLPTATLYDLLTVVTELVWNAVRYGEGDQIGLALAIDAEGGVRGEVQNKGPGHVRPRPVDLARGGGLGLHIVDAVAARWGARSDGVTRVFFELRRA